MALLADIPTAKDLQQSMDEVVERVSLHLTSSLQDLKGKVDSSIVEVSNILNGTLLGLQGIEDKGVKDLQNLVDSLYGSTLTITIPPITILLSKRKEGIN